MELEGFCGGSGLWLRSGAGRAQLANWRVTGPVLAASSTSEMLCRPQWSRSGLSECIHRRGVVLPLAVSPTGGPINFTVGHIAGCSSMLPVHTI